MRPAELTIHTLKFTLGFAALTTFWAIPSTADASVTIVTSLNSQDTIIGQRQNGGAALGYYPNVGGGITAGIGGNAGSRTNNNAVFGFLLPTLDPGVQILSATFQATVASSNPAGFSVGGPTDVALFGLSTTNPDVTGTSLFSTVGSLGAIDPTFTLTNAAAASTPAADVTTFIQSLYTGINPDQTEVFFRLSPTENRFTNVNRVTFANGTAQLVLVVTPEPGTALLSGLGLVALCLRRRRPGA